MRVVVVGSQPVHQLTQLLADIACLYGIKGGKKGEGVVELAGRQLAGLERCVLVGDEDGEVADGITLRVQQLSSMSV